VSYKEQTVSQNTPLNTSFFQHQEDGIEDASSRLDALTPLVQGLSDSLAALGVDVGTGGTTAGAIPGGATLPNPALHSVFILDGTGPVWADGSSWHLFSDNTTLSTAGGSHAPTNMTAVVQPDNSIALSWTAPVGVTVTSYKLYELRSPTGVSGASALSGTSTTRTPGTLGNYGYWVTALIGGVESAASNVATCTLPYGSSTGAGGGSTGGGTGVTPASLLGFGSTGGFWKLDIGLDSGNVTIDYPTLKNGYTNYPYFTVNTAGTAVQFYTDMAGKQTSSGTAYARTELRELGSDGVSLAAWNASTSSSVVHQMQYTFKILHIQPNKPWATIGQVHDSSSDALSIKVKGSTTSALDVVATIYDNDQSTALVGTYNVGDTVTIKINITGGSLKIYANNTLKITSSLLSGKTGLYFKVGQYPQSHDDAGGFESPTEYCQTEISALTVSHTPAI
jgi:hypothetical protein